VHPHRVHIISLFAFNEGTRICPSQPAEERVEQLRVKGTLEHFADDGDGTDAHGSAPLFVEEDKITSSLVLVNGSVTSPGVTISVRDPEGPESSLSACRALAQRNSGLQWPTSIGYSSNRP
jgi:hypothetical protein